MADPGWNGAELQLLADAARHLAGGFAELPGSSPSGPGDDVRAVLLETAERLRDNYPYFHPRYAGQMLKPPHPVARLAYALALLINPNNHALDGGRASSLMEREAVAELAAMVGWSTHLGHLTGGGTLANLEALWVGSRLHPAGAVLASQDAHYTHGRLAALLGIPFHAIAVDAAGRMDPAALEAQLRQVEAGTVVATLGTTGRGAVDPLPGMLALRQRYGFRLHVDAAYGGYFTLTDGAGGLGQVTRQAFDRMAEADSVVVDPHKHGLQPYGCGCVLFRDIGIARLYRHDSPYTYFTGPAGHAVAQHLGEIGLECSRAGAAATALWATQRLLPLVRGGGFAADLARSLTAARRWHQRLQADPRFMPLGPPELDIVVWAPAADNAAALSAASRRLFDAAAAVGLHLALLRVSGAAARAHWPDVEVAAGETVTCLRCCLMKPEHLGALDDLWALLDRAAQRVDARGEE